MPKRINSANIYLHNFSIIKIRTRHYIILLVNLSGHYDKFNKNKPHIYIYT